MRDRIIQKNLTSVRFFCIIRDIIREILRTFMVGVS